MMSKFAYLLIAAAALLVLQTVRSEEGPKPADPVKLAIDFETETYGLHLKVPHLAHLVEEWTPEKRQFYLKRIEPIFKFLIERTDGFIGKSVGMMTWGKILYELTGMVTTLVKSQKSQDMKANAGKAFNQDVYKLVGDILSESDKIVKKMKEANVVKDNAKLKVESKALLETIIEGVRRSPTGGYINWPEGTISHIGDETETSFIDFCAQYVADMKYHGYGGVASAAGNLISLARRLRGE